jgi:4-amino-4-deoxy-L-arabinose transferase-like glycosyltransferase
MKKSIINKFKKQKLFITLTFLVMILASYIIFYKLGDAPLDDWDEAWYGEMTKQILRTGQIVVLQWNGDFLFDKPPLYIWLSSIASLIFGLSEWSIRITSAITGLATIFIAWWYSYKKWGTIPALLTFGTLALNNIFIWRTRSGNLDTLATFLIFLTFFAILWKSRWRYPVLGTLFALIFLAKASLVAFPLAIFGISELLYNWRTIFILPVASWLLTGKQIAGQEFVEYYLYRSDQGVSNISLNLFKTDYWWHTYYSLQRRFFFVFVFGLLALTIRFFKKENLLLLGYSLFLLLLLSFTERNNNWYLVPSIPFWSLVVGYGTYQVLKYFPFKKFKWVMMVLILLPSLYVTQKTFRENIQPIIYTSSSTTQVESAKLMNKLSSKNDAIIRLDHLYPSAIFYSDRKVYASTEKIGNGNLFIGRTIASEKIKSGELKWAIGKTGDIENFVTTYELEGKIEKVNNDESYFMATPNITNR